ncbi:M61 family metallopeptidase [Amphiplicatus metriothermophilus]|uniref:M61 glycyl aminopeptidase n=1 Tax=Amphiplicatus metriothermophilus TaxID=1519374 RepID=A0A239PW01_9PROT|nr:hypothetical protein [Amphiplicatus metriothermophilus]MBB5519562.1 hypothetical protein [Amphiplicatus metriothermophilus]SNT74126.1 M61 glycyl aminopeptidase [Amphiplicatus metriothermophilus]
MSADVRCAARRLRAIMIAAAFLTGAAGCATARKGAPPRPSQETAAGMLEIVLRPVRDAAGVVSAIDVDAVLRGALQPGAEALVLDTPVVYAGVYGIADRVEDLRASDAKGAISFAAADEEPHPGGFPHYRRWTAQRAVTFPVRIRYRSRVQPAGGPGGPPFGIRPSAGGVSGAGSGFLVLPENVEVAKSRVRWDLSGFEKNASAATTFGEGVFILEGPADGLRQGWYMAGPIERYPDKGDVGGFSAHWLGAFPFDARAEMAWAGEAYDYLAKFFRYLDPAPRYRVFMRLVETPPYGGGTALGDSFMLSRGPARPEEIGAEGPRDVFFHEMIHRWVGGIEGPQGVTSWFSEGLTTYYAALLPMRGGFESVDKYGERINALARAYYVNPARNWTAHEIVEVGFRDGTIRHRPYQLGALYFADLDARIRAASSGARTLHDFMHEIFVRRETEEGFVFDHAAWKALVEAEIGDGAAAAFERIVLSGETIIPVSNAFGPCFERRETRFETEDRGEIAGYEWRRVETIPDSICRNY